MSSSSGPAVRIIALRAATVWRALFKKWEMGPSRGKFGLFHGDHKCTEASGGVRDFVNVNYLLSLDPKPPCPFQPTDFAICFQTQTEDQAD